MYLTCIEPLFSSLGQMYYIITGVWKRIYFSLIQLWHQWNSCCCLSRCKLQTLGELQAHLKFLRNFVSSLLLTLLWQNSVRNNCRTVDTHPAIYTSKRAARPGMVCYSKYFRYALPWRRNSQKTTPKNPIDFEWGKTEKNRNFGATLLWHTVT